MRVGIAWAGSPQHRNDANRSIRFEDWRPLFDIPDLSLVSLMHPSHPRHEDWQSYEWARPLECPLQRDDDFLVAARIVQSLDLVVSVDTAVAHLAGGMGMPCWLLLPASPDFRWGLRTSSSPWYPRHVLYRQHTGNSWPNVIRAVAEDLFTLQQHA
jgi:hypothetical protein